MVGHDRPGAASCSILAPIDRLPALDEDARQARAHAGQSAETDRRGAQFGLRVAQRAPRPVGWQPQPDLSGAVRPRLFASGARDGPGRRQAADHRTGHKRRGRGRADGDRPRSARLRGQFGSTPARPSAPQERGRGARIGPARTRCPLAQRLIDAGEDDTPEHQRRQHAEQDPVRELPRAIFRQRRGPGWGFYGRRCRCGASARHVSSPSRDAGAQPVEVSTPARRCQTIIIACVSRTGSSRRRWTRSRPRAGHRSGVVLGLAVMELR